MSVKVSQKSAVIAIQIGAIYDRIVADSVTVGQSSVLNGSLDRTMKKSYGRLYLVKRLHSNVARYLCLVMVKGYEQRLVTIEMSLRNLLIHFDSVSNKRKRVESVVGSVVAIFHIMIAN